jgi:hypothetical protein
MYSSTAETEGVSLQIRDEQNDDQEQLLLLSFFAILTKGYFQMKIKNLEMLSYMFINFPLCTICLVYKKPTWRYQGLSQVVIINDGSQSLTFLWATQNYIRWYEEWQECCRGKFTFDVTSVWFSLIKNRNSSNHFQILPMLFFNCQK